MAAASIESQIGLMVKFFFIAAVLVGPTAWYIRRRMSRPPERPNTPEPTGPLTLNEAVQLLDSASPNEGPQVFEVSYAPLTADQASTILRDTARQLGVDLDISADQSILHVERNTSAL